MDWEFEPILFQIFLQVLILCWVPPPRNFLDFLGDHFAMVESSGDQNLTMFMLHFHVFWIFDPSKSYENPRFPLTLQIKDSWDHAHMIERKILCRIALTRALYDQIRP